MRAQNLLDQSSSSSSSSSSSPTRPLLPPALSSSGGNSPFAAARRLHPDSHSPEHDFQPPMFSAARSTTAWHPSQPTPSRIAYSGDPCYDQLKNHHLYERNHQDGTVHLKPRERWQEATSKRDREVKERRRRS